MPEPQQTPPTETEVLQYRLKDDGTFPDNVLALLVNPGVVDPANPDPAKAFEQMKISAACRCR